MKDPILKDFWGCEMARLTDHYESEFLQYFTSKFNRFRANEMMRNIIGQTRSSFDLQRIMDGGKILLVNLSKGKIGEINSNLLGFILITKIQMTAMRRASLPEERRRDFYLYIDEFQNFTTESIAFMLSEARKYRLNLIIANQYVSQLEEEIRDAVLGNVGTLISFRVGMKDAELLEKEFKPLFDAQDLVNLSNWNVYIKLLVNNRVLPGFSMQTILDSAPVKKSISKKIIRLSRSNYGKERKDVEKDILEGLRVKTRQ